MFVLYLIGKTLILWALLSAVSIFALRTADSVGQAMGVWE